MLHVIPPQPHTSARAVYKQDAVDPASRLTSLLDLWEPRIARAFLSSLRRYRDELQIDELVTLIERGNFETVRRDISALAERVAATSGSAYGAAAQSTAEFLSEGLQVVIDFDQTNEVAVATLRQERLRLINNFTNEQVDVTRRALIDGTARGLNPIEQAREFRDSVGLTRSQHDAVRRYRESLEGLSNDALRRRLRDRDFDDIVGRAIRERTPLTNQQIDRMVTRYRESYIDYRSRVIARTEALRAVNGGNYEMHRQAVERGDLVEDELLRRWVTARDNRVRDSHQAMNGQEVRGLGTAFISGEGNTLRYPGDPNAPGSETIQCRCVVTTRIRRDG